MPTAKRSASQPFDASVFCFIQATTATFHSAPLRAAEFARWRASDPRHEAAVARLERAWAALQPLREFRPEAARHPDRDLLGARAPARRCAIPFPALAAATALAACLALAAGWWFGARHPGGPVEQRYATTAGGYERVALADGSLIELNSASEVGVQFSPSDRRVRLVRGEAHFTVAKNPVRPFVVEAGGVAVRAVGTAFSVRLGAREVEVLVTEGKVGVGPALAAAPLASAKRREDESRDERDRLEGVPLRQAAGQAISGRPTLLSANERIVIATARADASVSAPVVERITPAAVREALAWQGPRLVFADTPLAEAIAQFNRRNAVQLELADGELGALPIGGSFRAENVEGFVRLLVSGGDIAVERPDATRIVLRKAK